MKKLIKGTHHVAIKCKDVNMFEETVKFYTETLGLEKIRSWGEGLKAGTMISTGDNIIEIFAEGMAAEVTGTVNHFALATDDVDACVAAVKQAGYKITMEPTDIEIPAEVLFPARIAFCVGPAGEEIEFFCEK